MSGCLYLLVCSGQLFPPRARAIRPHRAEDGVQLILHLQKRRVQHVSRAWWSARRRETMPIVVYKQALAWTEKAAAQDQPGALGTLGSMYCAEKGVTSRELAPRARVLREGEQKVHGLKVTSLTQSKHCPTHARVCGYVSNCVWLRKQLKGTAWLSRSSNYAVEVDLDRGSRPWCYF